MPLSRLSSWVLLLALPALALLALSCEEEEEAAPAAVSELEDGVLQVGADIAYAPMEFFEEGTENAMGLDIDLARAIAEELGVDAEFVNTGWDGIIPALEAGRFDVIMSSMTITEERQERIDFIPYFTAGTGILVEAGNPQDIQTLADLCGKTVAVQVGTIQVEQMEAQNEECEDAISISTFDLNPMAVEQLSLGRADALLADYPVAGNDARLSEGELEVVGEQFETAPYGIGLHKDSTALNAAIEDALQAIMDSGEYDDILAEWGLEAGSVE
ncbi:MAG: ABC transporter substrate-binding protein [Dehalococcoidia bacterium]